jgi:hypothetical protein
LAVPREVGPLVVVLAPLCVVLQDLERFPQELEGGLRTRILERSNTGFFFAPDMGVIQTLGNFRGIGKPQQSLEGGLCIGVPERTSSKIKDPSDTESSDVTQPGNYLEDLRCLQRKVDGGLRAGSFEKKL